MLRLEAKCKCKAKMYAEGDKLKCLHCNRIEKIITLFEYEKEEKILLKKKLKSNLKAYTNCISALCKDL